MTVSFKDSSWWAEDNASNLISVSTRSFSLNCFFNSSTSSSSFLYNAELLLLPDKGFSWSGDFWPFWLLAICVLEDSCLDAVGNRGLLGALKSPPGLSLQSSASETEPCRFLRDLEKALEKELRNQPFFLWWLLLAEQALLSEFRDVTLSADSCLAIDAPWWWLLLPLPVQPVVPDSESPKVWRRPLFAAGPLFNPASALCLRSLSIVSRSSWSSESCTIVGKKKRNYFNDANIVYLYRVSIKSRIICSLTSFCILMNFKSNISFYKNFAKRFFFIK